MGHEGTAASRWIFYLSVTTFFTLCVWRLAAASAVVPQPADAEAGIGLRIFSGGDRRLASFYL